MKQFRLPPCTEDAHTASTAAHGLEAARERARMPSDRPLLPLAAKVDEADTLVRLLRMIDRERARR